MTRCYTDLVKMDSFEDRFNYLKLNGEAFKETFGYDRYINQKLYRSQEWQEIIRKKIICRDNGCDLGIVGREINGPIIVHHMNPITKHDILRRSELVINPEYLICMSLKTHNALHYGDISQTANGFTDRSPGDTKLW